MIRTANVKKWRSGLLEDANSKIWLHDYCVGGVFYGYLKQGPLIWDGGIVPLVLSTEWPPYIDEWVRVWDNNPPDFS